MKVLYLTNLPAPYTVEFLTELGKHCDLTVVFERHSASDRDEKWVSDTKPTYEEIFLEGKEIGTENSFCPSVKKYLKREYDHIVIGVYSTFTAMYAIRYLRKKKIPYIISTDGGFISSNEGNAKKKLKTKLIGGAAAWFSTCTMSDEYLIYYGADKDKIYRYPFTSIAARDIIPAPLTSDEKDKIKQKLGIKAEKVLIGVGQLIPRKGWDILVEALAKLNNKSVETLIVGGEEDQLKELLKNYEIETIPDNIRIISFMSKDDLFEYYRASDIFVLPTREDVWGLVVNEAMANGLPVISTVKCNAGVELIEEDVNGKLIPVSDSESLYNAIRKLLSEPERLAQMGENNLKKISSYTYEMMGIKVYEALLAIGSTDGNQK